MKISGYTFLSMLMVQATSGFIHKVKLQESCAQDIQTTCAHPEKYTNSPYHSIPEDAQKENKYLKLAAGVTVSSPQASRDFLNGIFSKKVQKEDLANEVNNKLSDMYNTAVEYSDSIPESDLDELKKEVSPEHQQEDNMRSYIAEDAFKSMINTLLDLFENTGDNYYLDEEQTYDDIIDFLPEFAQNLLPTYSDDGDEYDNTTEFPENPEDYLDFGSEYNMDEPSRDTDDQMRRRLSETLSEVRPMEGKVRRTYRLSVKVRFARAGQEEDETSFLRLGSNSGHLMFGQGLDNCMWDAYRKESLTSKCMEAMKIGMHILENLDSHESTLDDGTVKTKVIMVSGKISCGALALIIVLLCMIWDEEEEEEEENDDEHESEPLYIAIPHGK